MIATIITLFQIGKKKKNQVKHVLLHEILQTPPIKTSIYHLSEPLEVVSVSHTRGN